ncbi:MAG: MaoC family dehydratase, partial [Candidatus Hydrogenedentota bacterium]
MMKKGRTLAELPLGEKIEVDYTVEDRHIRLFAEATGDANPLHVDDEYAAQSPFKKRIAHGVLLSGIVSGVLGMHFPGLGTIAREMYSKYMKPIFIGDTVKVVAEVTDRNEKINLCTISFKVP